MNREPKYATFEQLLNCNGNAADKSEKKSMNERKETFKKTTARSNNIKEIKDLQSKLDIFESRPLMNVHMVYSDHCGPCRNAMPKFEDLARKISTKYPLVDKKPIIFSKESIDVGVTDNITAVPTFIINSANGELRKQGADFAFLENEIEKRVL